MLTINDIGKLNNIEIYESDKINNLNIKITGFNNKIFIDKSSFFSGVILVESNNSSVFINNDVRFTGKIFLKGEGINNVSINSFSTFGNVSIICSEGTNVSIGKNCMCSFDVELRTTDSHAIYDVNSKARINCAEDIVIGDNVWLAAHSKLLKGTKISSNSIVGFGAIVTKQFNESNIIIAGNPAKIIKKNIFWDRKLLG